MSWPARLAARVQIPLEAEFFQTVNRAPLHQSFIVAIPLAQYTGACIQVRNTIKKSEKLIFEDCEPKADLEYRLFKCFNHISDLNTSSCAQYGRNTMDKASCKIINHPAIIIS